MKKILILSSTFILLGFIVGNYIFTKRVDLVRNINDNKTYYFLEEGVYSSKEILDTNVSKIAEKVISKIDNYYHVYIGITKDKDIAFKIKELYEERGYKINVKEKKVNNEEFSNNVSQFDILLKEVTTFDEIITIERIVLSNYDDLINNYNSFE
jgi:hypothetical protein